MRADRAPGARTAALQKALNAVDALLGVPASGTQISSAASVAEPAAKDSSGGAREPFAGSSGGVEAELPSEGKARECASEEAQPAAAAAVALPATSEPAGAAAEITPGANGSPAEHSNGSAAEPAGASLSETRACASAQGAALGEALEEEEEELAALRRLADEARGVLAAAAAAAAAAEEERAAELRQKRERQRAERAERERERAERAERDKARSGPSGFGIGDLRCYWNLVTLGRVPFVWGSLVGPQLGVVLGVQSTSEVSLAHMPEWGGAGGAGSGAAVQD